MKGWTLANPSHLVTFLLSKSLTLLFALASFISKFRTNGVGLLSMLISSTVTNTFQPAIQKLLDPHRFHNRQIQAIILSGLL